MHYKIDYLCDEIRCILDRNEIMIIEECDIQYGFQIKTDIGAVINIYVTGKIYVSGDYYASQRIRKHFLDLEVEKFLDWTR